MHADNEVSTFRFLLDLPGGLKPFNLGEKNVTRENIFIPISSLVEYNSGLCIVCDAWDSLNSSLLSGKILESK